MELNYEMPNPRLPAGRKLGKTFGEVEFCSYLFKIFRTNQQGCTSLFYRSVSAPTVVLPFELFNQSTYQPFNGGAF